MLNPREKMPHLMIAATGSSRRVAKMVEMLDYFEEHGYSPHHIRYGSLSPDDEANVNESDSSNAGEVAFQKVLAVALSLGIIKDEEVEEDLLLQWKDINRINPQEKEVDLRERVCVFGGDVVTSVSAKNGREEDYRELLKLTRDLSGEEEYTDGDIAIIEKDKAGIVELYTSPEGFFVKYNIGLALLSNCEEFKTKGLIVSWEILLKLRPFPLEMVEAAYEQEGSAFKVGPRLDLASLAKDYLDEDFGIIVREEGKSEAQWLPVEFQVMKGLVVGGLLPPHMCLDLFANLNEVNPSSGEVVKPLKAEIKISSVGVL